MTTDARNTKADARGPGPSNYDLFIAVLTIFSLVVLAWLWAPWLTESTRDALFAIDTMICLIFLGDFAGHMIMRPRKAHYFLREGGWLDLLGSIPSINAARGLSLLRLARLARLMRIARLARARNLNEIIENVRAGKAEGAMLATLLLAIVALTIISIAVLQAESRAEDANITSGGDAFWWAFVTLTTIGYGDRYPVTGAGRAEALLLMTLGVGLFGVFTSYVSSLVLPRARGEASAGDAVPADAEAMARLERELQETRRELRELRTLLGRNEEMGNIRS